VTRFGYGHGNCFFATAFERFCLPVTSSTSLLITVISKP